jgi:rubrerythrin
MILTPDSDKNLLSTLVEFSYAEYGSALEMLYASKNVKSPNLKIGYINHAIDEYRHTRLIYSVLANQLNSNSKLEYLKEYKFRPINVVEKGYVDKKGFLFEKFHLKKFVEFVYTNEFLAKKSFDKLKLRIKDNESLNVITAIMDDEQDHADNSIETLDDIMADENKHWGYAQNYYEKKYPESKLRKAFHREKLKNKLRLAYLKNLKILNKIFDPIILILILIFGNLLRIVSIKHLKKTHIRDFNPKSII